MAYQVERSLGDGSNRQFSVPFPYLSKTHVHVFVDNVEDTTFTWINDTLIQTTVAPVNGAVVARQRITPTIPLVVFSDASTLGSDALNKGELQALYVTEESAENSTDALQQDASGNYDAQSKRISNLAPGATSTDAATKGQLDAAVVVAGNVPTPGAGNIGKFLKATAAAAWAWTALAYADISGLLAANAAAVRTAIGLQSGATTIVGTVATLNVGVAANNVVQLDGSAKLPAVDGSQLTNIVKPSVPVRQCAIGGTNDANGQPNWGGATGAATLTITGQIIVAAAGGFDIISGGVDRVGSFTAGAWTGLSTNGTMYLYLDVAANGTVTPGVTTIAPVYQMGGTYSVSSGQFTFNIQDMVGKLGNGATATQVWRVFVGEVLVAGNVVSTITWYAISARYNGPFTATLPTAGTAVSIPHNVGFADCIADFIAKCTTADVGYSVGDPLLNPGQNGGGAIYPTQMSVKPKAVEITVGNTGWATPNKVGGASAVMTNASWSYKAIVKRTW